MSADPSSYEHYALGAATFDPSGLPKEYFTLRDGSKNIGWVQTIFQALGLRSLLISSLKLEGFQYATIHGRECTAVIVKQQTCYLALLVEPDSPWLDEDFILWARSFDADRLKKNPRFQVV